MLMRRLLKALALIVLALPCALAAAALIFAGGASVALVAPGGYLWIAAFVLVPIALAIVLWRLASLIKTAR